MKFGIRFVAGAFVLALLLTSGEAWKDSGSSSASSSSSAVGSSSSFPLFQALPHNSFLTSQTVPWTVTGLLMLLPILCVVLALQLYVTMYGPSNIYVGPDYYGGSLSRQSPGSRSSFQVARSILDLLNKPSGKNKLNFGLDG